MEEFLLHSSVAVAWWLPYAAYADESVAFLDRLRRAESRVVISSNLITQTLGCIEAIEREYARQFPSDITQSLSNSHIASRFGELFRLDVLRVRSEAWRELDNQIIYNLEKRASISKPDASVIWLSIRENVRLLVADYDLYERKSDVEARFPESRIVLVSEVMA